MKKGKKDSTTIPAEWAARLKKLRSKRARVVAQHILEKGSITTDDIRKYGYNDPYRPTMDLRDEGIPLEQFKVKNQQGRTIAGYKFGDWKSAGMGTLGGRKSFSKEFKQALLKSLGEKCAVCLQRFESRYLQIDHRVPYHVAGDSGVSEKEFGKYMLLCGSCNRSKSWSCEHCENSIRIKDAKICNRCYWAQPSSYTHIAMKDIRRLDITWEGRETRVYDDLVHQAARLGRTVVEHIKDVLRGLIKRK